MTQRRKRNERRKGGNEGGEGLRFQKDTFGSGSPFGNFPGTRGGMEDTTGEEDQLTCEDEQEEARQSSKLALHVFNPME